MTEEGVVVAETPLMRTERKPRAPGAPKTAGRVRRATGTSECATSRDALFLKIGRIDSMNVNQLACKVVARMRDEADVLAVYSDTSLGEGCQERHFNVDNYIDVEVKHGDKEERVIKQVFDDVHFILSTLSYIAGPRHVVYYDLSLVQECVGIDGNLLRFMLSSARGTPPICVVVPEE